MTNEGEERSWSPEIVMMAWGVTSGRIAVINALVGLGTDLNVRFTEGNSYLTMAVLSRQRESVKALLRAGADINAQQDDGMSPLNIASREGCTDIVGILLDNSANMETKDNDGCTPLYNAACNGHCDIVKVLSERGATDNTVLLAACVIGHFDVVRRLVDNGAKINSKSEQGLTPLHCASEQGHADVVELLLTRGADVNTTSNDGISGLFVAASNGHTDVVRLLLSAGADVNAQCNDGLTALHVASLNGNIHIVNMLLDQKVDTETRNGYGYCTPLLYAVLYAHNDVVRALLSAGADVNTRSNDGDSALTVASEEGYTDTVKMLLDNGALVESRNNDGETPLSIAAARGHTNVVRLLLSARADVNVQCNDGLTALHKASLNGYVHVVNMLLDQKAEIETGEGFQHCTPLWFAVEKAHVDVVHALVSAGADVNIQRDDGIAALRFASNKGYTDIVKALLDNGAQVETKDNDGETSLHDAAACGHTDVVHALLSAGADVNALDNEGDSALGFASAKGYTDIVNVLLDYGAEVETRNNDGETPLYDAAGSGHISIVPVLLSAGADVNTQRNDGVSALGVASDEGHAGTVKMLLDNGALIESRNNDGATPLLFAAARGHTDVARSLLSAGAHVNIQRNDGLSALHVASLNGHVHIVNMLLDQKAHIETREVYFGCTPLWYAVEKAHVDVVHALVSAGADGNTKPDDGIAALGFASGKGYMDIVKVLLDNGALVETKDNDGETPIYYAARCGHTDVVRILLSAGADANAQRADSFTTLGVASENGQTNVVKVLLDNGADVNLQHNDGISPLHVASREGHVDVVNILLESNADIEARDNNGCTPLWLAAARGQTKVIEALVARGADVDALDYTRCSPVCEAAMQGHTDTVMALIGHNASIRYLEGCEDPLGNTVLWGKADVDRILQLFMENDATIDATDGMNHTPLMMAAQTGRLECVKVFVQHGSNIHARSFDNLQAVDIASYSGQVDTVNFLSHCYKCEKTQKANNQYPSSDIPLDIRCNTALHMTTDVSAMRSLLENGADAQAENVDGLQPIHCAIRTGIVELVELLIEHSANIDAADVFGNRPLHEAVCQGLNVVQLLVQRGATLNVQNADGKTPLHVAVERQQCDVVAFLLSQDADAELTDVWRNTPFHYVTGELLGSTGVAEHIVKLLMNKRQDTLILNTVGVSELTHIIAQGILNYPFYTERISNLVATLVQKQNTKCFLKSAVHHRQQSIELKSAQSDSLGNTPLHQAVGVYAGLKMFRVSTDVTTVVNSLVKHGFSINAQNNDGLTPLHVARGEQAIKACLQHSDERSFTVTDKRSRNFWHLLFLTRNQNEVELASNIGPMIPVSNDKYDVDDLNRIPLHYACMGRNDFITRWVWLAKEFIETCKDEHINKQDKFGRTALHYATIGGNDTITNLLKKKKADDAIQDNFKKTADEYKNIRQNFNTQLSCLRLTKSGSSIARNFRAIVACVRQYYFADGSINSERCRIEVLKIVRDLRGCDATSYVQKILLGCRFDYAVCYDRERFSHKQCVYERDNLITQPPTTSNAFPEIRKRVKTAMEHLAEEISAQDSRFACQVVEAGSVTEGTKIGCCDEFDYNFVLTNLSKICKVCFAPESPPGFVLLKSSIATYDKDLFDSNGTLNTRIVKFKFETFVKQVMSSLTFCEITGFEIIEPASDWLLPGIVSKKLQTCIQLVFTKPVNGCHVLHTISVDIVPALRIDDWWPEDARREELCQTGDCLIVFTQPQNKYPWIGWTEPHGFISFARAESRLLRECPPVVRDAYMVVKRMLKYFCVDAFWSSHVIKTALLWCLDDKGITKCKSLNYGRNTDANELLGLVQNIFRRLLSFAAQDFVPSYFIPKCRQPVWLGERYLKQFHMHLYQHGLTYNDLFGINEQQSLDRLLQDIKYLFVFSHVMYWTVLSDTNEFKFFVPSTVNPLTEIDYNLDVDTGS